MLSSRVCEDLFTEYREQRDVWKYSDQRCEALSECLRAGNVEVELQTLKGGHSISFNAVSKVIDPFFIKYLKF